MPVLVLVEAEDEAAVHPQVIAQQGQNRGHLTVDIFRGESGKAGGYIGNQAFKTLPALNQPIRRSPRGLLFISITFSHETIL